MRRATHGHGERASPESLLAVFEAHHAAPFDEVAETVSARDEHRQVRRCLARLTRLQRESVVLAYYRGLTHRELGDSPQIPSSTVKSRIHDGLIRLRDCLGVTG